MKKAVFAAVALLAVSAGVSAAQGPYLGGNLGYGKFDIESGSSSFNDNSTVWKVNGGYQFTDMFGVEAFYQDSGSISYTANNNQVNTDYKAYGAALTGTYQFTRSFDGTLKVGAAGWKTGSHNNHNGTGVSTKEQGTDLYLGMSLGYMLNDNVKLVANVDRIKGNDSVDITSMVYGAGVQYYF